MFANYAVDRGIEGGNCRVSDSVSVLIYVHALLHCLTLSISIAIHSLL